MQNLGDAGVGRQRIMAGMGLVHRYHIRHPRGAQVSAVIGIDGQALRRFDFEGGMAEKSDGDVFRQSRKAQRSFIRASAYIFGGRKPSPGKLLGNQLALADGRAANGRPCGSAIVLRQGKARKNSKNTENHQHSRHHARLSSCQRCIMHTKVTEECAV